MKKIVSIFIVLLIILSIGVPECLVGTHVLPNSVEAASPRINKRYSYLKVGDTVKLNVKDTKGKITWSSSDKAIALVKNGLVKAKREGKVKITATVNKKNYYCYVIVNAIALNYESTDLSKGQILELKLAGIPGKEVKWKSSNKKIVTVDKSGKIKGIKAGEAKIDAIYKDKTYTCNVTVLGKEILIFSNDDVDIYYYSAKVSMIDKQLYDLSEAPDEEFTNVDIRLRVRNKMNSRISCSVDLLKLNDIYVDEIYSGEIIPSNSIKTLQVQGYIDPFYHHAEKFKVKKISGDITYYASHYRGEEHFSKKLK